MSKIIQTAILAALLCVSKAPAETLVRPSLEVFKSKRELLLLDGERLIKTYPIALGSNPIPPKTKQGDRATPEGRYFICVKNPKSQYYLSLGISYPGAEDAERGFRAGLISENEKKAIVTAAARKQMPPWNTALGGEIFIHGRGSKPDWTWGCIALDDKAMDELYLLLPVGTPIVIHP